MEREVNALRLSRQDQKRKECLYRYNLEREHIKIMLENWKDGNVSDFHRIFGLDSAKELEGLVYDFADYICWKASNNDGDKNVYEFTRQNLVKSMDDTCDRLCEEIKKNGTPELKDIVDDVSYVVFRIECLHDCPELNMDGMNNCKEQISQLSHTIQSNTRTGFYGINRVELDRKLFLSYLDDILTPSMEYIEHLLTLVQTRSQNHQAQLIFHLNWVIKLLSQLPNKIIHSQDELKNFRSNRKNYTEIQSVVSDLLDIFQLLDAPELLMVWKDNYTEDELSICDTLLKECQHILRQRMNKLENDLEEDGDSN